MNITELDSYNLADAVKFHNRLNPKIWGKDEHLLPDVRQKLLEIAADFQEFLGIDDLAVEDITVSGSNAAYSYTPHSDIDLHLVVRMPEQADEVYQELFNAKKYQYNDLMDIKIHGADVELYVQPADQTPVSLGEYSIKNDQWIQVPRRKRAKIDHSVVKHKYEDIKARIESALKEDDSDRIQALIDKIKAMRQSGLDQHGEFGAENLAFKMLRSQGWIKKLYDHRAATRARELSLREQNKPRQRFRYGFGEGHQGQPYSSEDGVAPTTCMFLNEDDTAESIVNQFIIDTAKRLGIEKMPRVELHSDDDWSVKHHSFGMYEPETHTLHVNLNDRHVLDILRTVAHELTHCRQNELNKLPDDAGETGSPWENEANAVAGEIMRDYAEANPDMFKEVAVKENASGYIPKNKKEARDPRYSMAVTVDIKPGQVGKEANKLALNTGRNGEPGLLMKSANLRESLEAEFALFESGQDLFEIKMSPSNLRQEAAKTGAMAGMEFEMIVPGISSPDDDYSDLEPDYDYDQRCRSIQDVYDFFYDGDYNDRRTVQRAMDRMRDDYTEWLDNKILDDFGSDGEDYIREWVANNVDESEWNPDDLEGDARNEALDEYAANIYADPSSDAYNQAFDEYREENQENWDESDWLDSQDLDRMSAIEGNYDLNWPHWHNPNEGSGEADIDAVAEDFSNAIDRPVNASSSYHGGRREPGHYVVEPDGSLDPDDSDDTGLEFVSPPLPIDELLSDLNKVKKWADREGCYTNSSTGLHINVSVPGYTLAKLDYVKLALLLGDKYVLDQYGRSSNTYTKSALGKVQDLIKRNPDSAKQLMDKMRGHMEDLATKAIHSGTTDKYTSINTKNGYIEFRSPGGDWLNENFDKIENTLLRFTVALSAAIDPNAYREEYLKKLYKLLEPTAVETKAPDTIKYFSDYVAGKMPKAALRSFIKQAQLERRLKKGEAGGEEMWWRVSNPQYSDASIEVVARTKEEAIAKALEPSGYPSWKNTIATIVARPLRPYETKPVQAQVGAPQPVGRQAPASGPTVGGRASNPEGAWILARRGENPPVPLFRFGAASVDDANTVMAQWQQEHPGDAVDVHYDPEITRGQPGQQRAPGRNYEIYRGDDRDDIVAAFVAADDQAAQERLERYRRDHPGGEYRAQRAPVPGSTMDIQRQRQQAALQQSNQPESPFAGPGEGPFGGQPVAQRPQPLGAGRELVGWSVRLPSGEEVTQIHGIGNSQADANRIAAQWLRDNGMGVSGEGFEVVPLWREA